MVNLIKVLLSVCLTWSCSPQKILMPKNVGLTNQLRLDGFYYTSVNPKTDAVKIIFLYENGVVLDMFSFDKVDTLFLTKRINEKYYKDKSQKKSYLDWGVYQLNNNQISITSWYPSSGGPLPVFVKKGSVVNDTTFVINWYETTKGKKLKDLNGVYKFVKFIPKPDSTNTVLK